MPKDESKQPTKSTEPESELIPIAVLICIYIAIGFIAGFVVGFIFVTSP